MKQSSSETGTYGVEFLSGRTCCEQIIDHRTYCRYSGKPVFKMDYVWGDNKSMIRSSTVPDAKLHKRHNILSFHFVRSMIARGYINLLHIMSKYNFADILTKNWGYQGTYHELIQPVFHHVGNTASLFLDDTLECDISFDQKTIFAIMGSEKIKDGSESKETRVCGQTVIFERSTV